MGKRTSEEVRELIREMAFYVAHKECTLISAADYFDITPSYASVLINEESIKKVVPLMKDAVRAVIESHRPYPGMADYRNSRKNSASSSIKRYSPK